jgi:ABC-2 type transport system permease protein
VARHEFRVTVKRVWFLVATFGLPLLILGIAGGMGLLAQSVVRESLAADRGKPVGLIDLWGGLSTEPREFRVRRFPDEEAATAALRQKDVAVYLVVPGDYLDTGRVRMVTMRRPTIFTAERPPVPDALEGWIVENVLREVDAPRVARAKKPLDLQAVYLDASGKSTTRDAEEVVKQSMMAYAIFFLMFTAIFTASAYLLQGMAEEKENRVMEMVLSSVTPGELMTGKLLGLGAAGFLQLLVWIGMSVVGVVAFALGIVLEPGLVAFCVLFFLLGYVLYGALILGFGALGTNFRESQQMAAFWQFVGVSPVFIVMALFEAPQGALARVFSLIPFTAPTTIMFRYAIDPQGTPILDIVAAALILVASTYFALKFSARLYRAGLLLYGKRPGLREIWRWLRAAS